jgi:tRNA pseudouridine(38-40) synthase
VRTASRTDIGVHALCNAFTFDTVQSEERKNYECEEFRRGLNHYMITNEEQIQINDVKETVDKWFDCRSSPSQRTYLYKMIIVNGRKLNVDTCPIKLFNDQRAWIIPSEGIDLDKLSEATQFFVGRHYLRNFVRVNIKEVSLLDII